jgi:uncharacterized protein YjaZ
MVSIYILSASGRLHDFEYDIRQSTELCVSKINNIVVFDSVDIIVRDNPERSISEIGIGGFTENKYIINLSLNPQFPNFKNVINKYLPRILTHEAHHILRMRACGYGTTLLEALVSEGLADHFDIEINNEAPLPWSVALTKNDLDTLIQRAGKEYFNSHYNHKAWFFGSQEKNIPRWSGYAIGYYLVGKYLKNNSEKRPSNLIDRPAIEFLS